MASLISYLFVSADSDADAGNHTRPRSPGVRDSLREQKGVDEATLEIVRSIRAGDLLVFERVYREYFTRLSRHAFLLVQSADVAEEIAQEILWSLWERKETLVVRRTLASYLHAAVHRRTQHYLRDQRNRSRLLALARDDEGLLMTRPASASHHLESAEIVAEVRHAIQSLPASRRLVLTLRWDNGLSYAEIAEIVGSSVKAVENQLNRTLRQLQTKLAHLRP